MLALSFAAAVTSKIRLATGIFRALAQAGRNRQGRRLAGRAEQRARDLRRRDFGWFAEEFAAAGASFNDWALRTREYIELMKALWTEEDPVYEGKTFSLKGVR